MNAEEQYPSTDDCAIFLQEGENAVALCLANGMKRVEASWTKDAYIGGIYNNTPGSVCALGGVFAAIGKVNTDLGSFENGQQIINAIAEEAMHQEAIEAIRLLNEAATQLYPWTAGADSTRWQGPLEYLNQEYTSHLWGEDYDDSNEEDSTQAAVLRCYRRAISMSYAA